MVAAKDPFEPLAAAIRDERTRIFSGLIKLRHKFLGKAHATRSTRPYVAEAYDEAASAVAEYIQNELGKDPEAHPPTQGGQ